MIAIGKRKRQDIRGFTSDGSLGKPRLKFNVVGELIAIAFIRYRFMSGNLWTTIGQVIVGGGIVFGIGIWLGRIGAS
jgi:hypothetical protein